MFTIKKYVLLFLLLYLKYNHEQLKKVNLPIYDISFKIIFKVKLLMIY